MSLVSSSATWAIDAGGICAFAHDGAMSHGAHVPQSDGQVAQVSSPTQKASPHRSDPPLPPVPPVPPEPHAHAEKPVPCALQAWTPVVPPGQGHCSCLPGMHGLVVVVVPPAPAPPPPSLSMPCPAAHPEKRAISDPATPSVGTSKRFMKPPRAGG